jgi:hypothetical protein
VIDSAAMLATPSCGLSSGSFPDCRYEGDTSLQRKLLHRNGLLSERGMVCQVRHMFEKRTTVFWMYVSNPASATSSIYAFYSMFRTGKRGVFLTRGNTWGEGRKEGKWGEGIREC